MQNMYTICLEIRSAAVGASATESHPSAQPASLCWAQVLRLGLLGVVPLEWHISASWLLASLFMVDP